jgi:HlyD family secretion protein
MKKAIIVLVIIAAVVGGTAYFRRQASADTTSYLFVPVTRGDLESTVSATGTLSAVDSVQVGTQVSGIIDALYADFNDHVHKGELIGRLDTTVLKLAVDREKATVQQATASLRQAEFSLQQIKRLLATKAETETDYETALAAEAVGRANLAADSVALKQANQNLAYAYIYSPINGIVIKRTVDVGQTVAASFSAPELFLLAGDLQDMQIVASVDESDIGQIHDGQDVDFTVEAFPNRIFHGLVQQVRLGATTQDNVVNYPVVVRVKNADGALLPGMTATVSFEIAKQTNVLRVPEAVLRFQPTESMIAQFRAERQAAGDSGRGGARSDSGARGDSAARGGARGARGFGGGAPGGGFAGGRGGRGGRGGGARPGDVGMLWYLTSAGKLAVARVHTGLSDGQYVAISGPDVHEGMQIIAAVTSGGGSSAVQNPFSGAQGRGRGGFRGGF